MRDSAWSSRSRRVASRCVAARYERQAWCSSSSSHRVPSTQSLYRVLLASSPGTDLRHDPDRLDAVPPGDLLALLAAAGPVADRHLERPDPAGQQLGGD